jgi:hypothetical protein
VSCLFESEHMSNCHSEVKPIGDVDQLTAIRSRLPALRTLPSSTVSTPSVCPILR